jgi:Uma2 family endonuclease
MDTVVLRDSITGNLSDAEFLRFCQENSDLRIERNSNLEIVIMSPVSTKSGYHSGAAYAQLFNWSMIDKRGFAFDSSTGFTLPDRSVFSPDASWISKQKWTSLTDDEQSRFAPICPEFVIEVRSKTDQLADLKRKMETWLANGTELAWIIDPFEKHTYIYRNDGITEMIDGFDVKIRGEKSVDGFTLDLSLLSLI